MIKDEFLFFLNKETLSSTEKKELLFFINKLNGIKHMNEDFFTLDEKEIMGIFELRTPGAKIFCERFFEKPFYYKDACNNYLINEIDNIIFKNRIDEIASLKFTDRVFKSSMELVSSYSLTNEKKGLFDNFCKRAGLCLDDFIKNINVLSDEKKIEVLFKGIDYHTNMKDFNLINFGEVLGKLRFETRLENYDIFLTHMMKVCQTSNKITCKNDLVKLIFSVVEDKERFCKSLEKKLKESARINTDHWDNGFSDNGSKVEGKLKVKNNLESSLLFLEKIYLNLKIREHVEDSVSVVKKRL